MPKQQRWGDGATCLIVADPGPERDVLAAALARVGLRCGVAGGAAEALAALEREPVHAVLLSTGVGPAAAERVMARCRQGQPEAPVVCLGVTATVGEAVEAMQRGAVDYLPAPVLPAVLELRLRRLLQRDGAAPDVAAAAPEYFGIVGSSAAMRSLHHSVDKVSRYKTSVLLLGESGTGKELIARALHARGPRRRHLFVPINCATLGRELLENELFGHERGAFTGANDRKKGLLELADGGTLFLDEIGEMDLTTQAKLLRVLERGAFRRVGGTEKVKVDLSLVAATNKDLGAAIAGGTFREDLYYRLKVVTLVVPPLRERREDIPALIEHFIADFNRRNGQKIAGIAPASLKRLMEYSWPGNVRELKNAIESAAVMAGGETLSVERLAPPGAPAKPGSAAPLDAALRIVVGTRLDEIERHAILRYLDHYGSKAEAAQALGIGLRTLYTKLQKYTAESAAPSRSRVGS